MNKVIELATATISSLLDVQAQLLVQLERLQPAAPKCSECGDNRLDLSLYCAPCLNNDGWYQLSPEEASRIESAQPVVPKSAAWVAGYNAGLAMAETWRDDAPAAGAEQSMNRKAFEKWVCDLNRAPTAWEAWQAALQSGEPVGEVVTYSIDVLSPYKVSFRPNRQQPSADKYIQNAIDLLSAGKEK